MYKTGFSNNPFYPVHSRMLKKCDVIHILFDCPAISGPEELLRLQMIELGISFPTGELLIPDTHKLFDLILIILRSLKDKGHRHLVEQKNKPLNCRKSEA